MNNRTLLIIAGISLPVIVIAAVLSTGTRTPTLRGTISAPIKTPRAHAPAPSLEEMRASTQKHLEHLQSMTDDQWPDELKHHPRAAPTRQEAIARTQRRLAQLEKMTPDEWNNFMVDRRQPQQVRRNAAPPINPNTVAPAAGQPAQ